MGGEIGGENLAPLWTSTDTLLSTYLEAAKEQANTIHCLQYEQGMELLHHFVLMEEDYATHMPKH